MLWFIAFPFNFIYILKDKHTVLPKMYTILNHYLCSWAFNQSLNSFLNTLRYISKECVFMDVFHFHLQNSTVYMTDRETLIE